MSSGAPSRRESMGRIGKGDGEVEEALWRHRREQRRELVPSTSSMADEVRVTSSTECTVTMFGWLRAATTCASRSSCLRFSGESATWGGSILMATLPRASCLGRGRPRPRRPSPTARGYGIDPTLSSSGLPMMRGIIVETIRIVVSAVGVVVRFVLTLVS